MAPRPARRQLTAAVVTAGAVAVTAGTANDPADPRSSESHEGMVTGTVWVANEDGGSLTAIDAATHQVRTSVTGIAGPHNVQVSPDGASIWAVSGHESVAARLVETLERRPTGKSTDGASRTA